MKNKDSVKLIEKIESARFLLEQGKRTEHNRQCSAAFDPTTLCSCGVADHNAFINKVLHALSLDK